MSLKMYVEPALELPFVYSEAVPTSIVRIHTPSGFVIAGDGYATDGSLNNQKVFAFNAPFVKAGFGLSGCGGVKFVNNDRVLTIDFNEECQNVADKFHDVMTASFDELANRFTQTLAKYIQRKISSGVRRGSITEDDLRAWVASQENNGCSRLQFAGYHRVTPCFATTRLKFGATDPEAVLEKFTIISPGNTVSVLYGSKQVEKILLIGDDARFSQFRTNGLLAVLRSEEATLADGIDAAQNYIQACASLPAREIDSFCNSIDGHIHIATITANEGFRWAIEPLNG